MPDFSFEKWPDCMSCRKKMMFIQDVPRW